VPHRGGPRPRRAATSTGGGISDGAAGLLPTTPEPDDLAVTRQQARKLFDGLLRSEGWAVLLLTQLLARLSVAAGR
jgi:hypothetical protein